MIYVMIQLAINCLVFVFSRSDEPIVIGVCGMRSADQDHRIGSEAIASGSFLESALMSTINHRDLIHIMALAPDVHYKSQRSDPYYGVDP